MNALKAPPTKARFGFSFLKRTSSKAPPAGPGANRQPPGSAPDILQAAGQQPAPGNAGIAIAPDPPTAPGTPPATLASSGAGSQLVSAVEPAPSSEGPTLPPASEGQPSTPPEAQSDSGTNDLLDIFKEEMVINEELHRLAKGLGPVDTSFLVAQCREMAQRLDRRR